MQSLHAGHHSGACCHHILCFVNLRDCNSPTLCFCRPFLLPTPRLSLCGLSSLAHSQPSDRPSCHCQTARGVIPLHRDSLQTPTDNLAVSAAAAPKQFHGAAESTLARKIISPSCVIKWELTSSLPSRRRRANDRTDERTDGRERGLMEDRRASERAVSGARANSDRSVGWEAEKCCIRHSGKEETVLRLPT